MESHQYSFEIASSAFELWVDAFAWNFVLAFNLGLELMVDREFKILFSDLL